MAEPSTATTDRARVRVRGQVQGVGFRPFVYGLAHRLALSGWVLNDGEGVLIEVQGPRTREFLTALGSEPPSLARIEAIEATAIASRAGETGFTIRDSVTGQVTTGVTPDAAVCPDCLGELFDPGDRRYLYPFLNCTRCGPRHSITRHLPYDRPQTAMAGFALCPDCAHEYADPTDRRFHAQPTACPACGPRLAMPVAMIASRLRAGQIVAIKGLGGFHLACDARNPEAVNRLRRVKQRSAKPFAVMAANAASAALLGEIGPVEAGLLTGSARPVVLLRRHANPPVGPLAAAVAPDLDWLGVMLPYTPLHYLLFHALAGSPTGLDWLDNAQAVFLVMTSANPGGEPLVIDDAEAARRLAGIADAIAGHDRPIIVRSDDSVVRVIGGAGVPIRRARGFVPQPIRLPRAIPTTLATGGHFKNTVCVSRGDQAYLSQHIGDLDNVATLAFLEETVAHLLQVLEITPARIACDPHPDFLATRFAARFAADRGLPCIAVQHHHAHIAAVAAEHGCVGPVIGLALDGFGLGRGQHPSWGGELLLARSDGEFERLGHLATLPQPGGDIAARQPWRMAAAALHRMGRRADIARRFPQGLALVEILDRGLNCPATTSCGRWFDAACGLLGVRANASYEGEAPMVLESLVRTPTVLDGGWTIHDGVLDLLPLLAVLADLADPGVGADLFHGTLAAALVAWARPEVESRAHRDIMLSGGCLINRPLAEGLIRGFADCGITARIGRRAPPNDGGLALGQTWVAGQSAPTLFSDL
ncbi:MAG: carbamoyltransferase HypF [Azospirillaceae bacterium]|nr:carbamoyltransferase HypF [Azospirillaceae bacterium]